MNKNNSRPLPLHLLRLETTASLGLWSDKCFLDEIVDLSNIDSAANHLVSLGHTFSLSYFLLYIWLLFEALIFASCLLCCLVIGRRQPNALAAAYRLD